MSKVKKAIIPVAGMGTRFLPATKAQPKEMLPVVDKPVIQYIVEEAVAAGIEEVIFVTALGKRAIEDHFDRSFELEFRLEQKGKHKELASIRQVNSMAKFAYVRQKEPLGDGHALLAAEPFIIDDEPVAVMFGDDIIAGGSPAIGELIDVFERRGAPVVALQEVPEESVSRYGIVDGTEVEERVWSIERFMEKPSIEEAPSRLAAVGRYIITRDIFEALKKQEPGKDGEIRLADVFTGMAGTDPLYGCVFQGKRYDCGDKADLIIAALELGMQHPEIGERLRSYMARSQS
jgi:UTP--glucose-1-phosphate uridylyltransferase